MACYRMHAAQGRNEPALSTLRNVYARFNEGFDTGDLIEARDLLR
jgi:hypothetical protein